MFSQHKSSCSRFDHLCKCTLTAFGKKWHPTSKRLEYIETFSILKWKELPEKSKEHHSITNCNACYSLYLSLQQAFPDKPIYEPGTPITLPTLNTEKEQAQKILADLNPVWQSHYSRTFTEAIPSVVPESNLVQKKTRIEQKKRDRTQKRNIVREINGHFRQQTSMLVLAEAESLAAYGRKRLALSYEKPETPQTPKSHSPNEQNMSWSIDEALNDLENFPPEQIINWSAMARKHNIPGKNAGQVLKETAKKYGINTAALDQRDDTPRVRRRKCRLPGGEICMPCLPTVQVVKEEQKQLILSGQLSVGEPCAPFALRKSILTNDGNVEIQSFQICGRKIPLIELRKTLLHKQQKYMHLFTDEQLSKMSNQDIHKFMNMVHHESTPDASCVQLTQDIKRLQRSRTLAMWHDHSTILQTGYILFALWVVYDPAVFYTQEQWSTICSQKGGVHIQSLVEEPLIYMIAPSSSSPSDQLALVGDRTECLTELSTPVFTSDGTIEINDCLRFFCGDKPAQQFERGTQIGGTYKCGGCGCKDTLMMDLAHTLYCSWISLSDLQELILAGRLGNKPGCLKPLDNLKIEDLRVELQARGVKTDGLLKPQLSSQLTEILQGAKRVPTLLNLNPTQTLESLNLSRYEVLDCEPLHDLKGHLYNLLPEIPHLLPTRLQNECQKLLDTTLPKQKVSGAHLRVSAVKLYVKLRCCDIDPLLKALLNTIVRISEILYSFDSKRTPKIVLRLYNITWFHHELCYHFLSNPKHQSRSHLFGIYLHDLVAHAPCIYQEVCLRSTNAESQERLFSQAKHIGLRATNRKPENILPTILLCMQAKQNRGDCLKSICQQDSMVSKAATHVEKYTGTRISNAFITNRLSSWQAHLTRISSFLKHGKDIWWKVVEDGIQFLDGDNDPDFRPEGPQLLHFRSKSIADVHRQASRDWSGILETNTILPTPSIRLYDPTGNYNGSIAFPSTDMGRQVSASKNVFLSDMANHGGTGVLNETPEAESLPPHSIGTPEALESLPSHSTGILEALESPPPHSTGTPEALESLPSHSTGILEALESPPPHSTGIPEALESLPLHSTGTPEVLESLPPHSTGTSEALESLPSHSTGTPRALESLPPHSTGTSEALESLPPHSTGTPMALESLPPHSIGISEALECLPPHSAGTPEALECLPPHSIGTPETWKMDVCEYDPGDVQATSSNTQCTPSRSHGVSPRAMFKDTECTKENMQCNMEFLEAENANTTEIFKTKAARLIETIIGQSSDLKQFDQLRQRIKEGMKRTGRKPTTSEKEDYKTLLAKLESSLLSIKYATKDQLKAIEKELTACGKDLHSQKTPAQYTALLTRLGHVKKILSVWSHFQL